MQKITRHKKTKMLDSGDYVNHITGERLDNEVNGSTVLTRQSNGTFEIDSEHYVRFDSAAVAYLMRELKPVDVTRVFKMSDMVRGQFSVISHKNNLPHTSDSLAEALGMHVNQLYIMVRRLVKKNVLAYCICAPSGHLTKVYMLNPFIARKARKFSEELLDNNIFRNVTLEKV